MSYPLPALAQLGLLSIGSLVAARTQTFGRTDVGASGNTGRPLAVQGELL
jgi:hypothetical protein